VNTPPPLLGEHSRQVLAGLGLSQERIDALVESGVIGIPA
jgi:crotonobetainyl-CoA:carnitine CoA-transferase CaiB-like acyl-CoA transferase